MNKTFAIGIPTINRYDLLHEALEQYFYDFPTTEIYVIDNGKQGIKVSGDGFSIYEPWKNLGVAQSWNYLCENIFAHKYDYAFLLNDDIYMGITEDQLLDWIRIRKRTMPFDFAVGTGTWCSFLLPKKTFQEIGKFDENFFPAYFEDNDYHYRLKLQGKTFLQNDFLNPKVYRNSMTIAKDSSLNNRFNDNKNYYIKKWGGEPGQEKYILPFNGNN